MTPLHLQNVVFDEDHRQMFLDQHGWSITSSIGQDSSIRRYFRVSKNNQTAILMETVPDGSPHATPGHSLSDFIRIAQWLRSIDVSAPEIYEVDETNGYALLEDFGDTCIRDMLENGEDVVPLYESAVDILNHIAARDCPLELPNYYDSHVHKRHRRVVDWFIPASAGHAHAADALEVYMNTWKDIENSLPSCPQGFIHVDYHAQNLMVKPDQSIGVLDFQGAMIGPLMYDFTNLLKDARCDVPPEVQTQILGTFDENARLWFRILAAQFHCRVIGQFIKMAVLDENDRYLRHIPRLQTYMATALKDPILKPLKQFFDDAGVDFTREVSLSQASLKLIREITYEDAV